MKRLKHLTAVTILIALCAVVGFTAGVRAQQPTVRDDLLPRIVMVEHEVLQRMVCEDPKNCLTIGAAYSEGTIYLKKGWRPDSIESLGVLLHEMVHHIQHLGAVAYQCDARKEPVAYDVQEAWLRAHGVDLAKAAIPDKFTQFFIGACPEDML